jgi:hypothetical protein
VGIEEVDLILGFPAIATSGSRVSNNGVNVKLVAFGLRCGNETWSDLGRHAEINPPNLTGLCGGNTVIKLVPREGGWLKRHEGFVAQARQGGIDVLFVGDSITDGWRNQKLWQERYVPLKAADFGISADRTEHVLWRLQNGELDGIKPKVVVLMIGTNNTRSNSAPEIVEGIAAIVKEFRTRLPQSNILLLGVFPRDAQPDTPNRVKIKEINSSIARLDDAARSYGEASKHWMRVARLRVRSHFRRGGDAVVWSEGERVWRHPFQAWPARIRPDEAHQLGRVPDEIKSVVVSLFPKDASRFQTAGQSPSQVGTEEVDLILVVTSIWR